MFLPSTHYRKFLLITVMSFAGICFQSEAQSPEDAQIEVETTLNNYLNGSSYNRPDQIKSAFYAESDMFLHHLEKPIYRMNSLEYAELFEKRKRDEFNGRFGKILDIDVSGDIATAKAEILMPKIEARFIDIFILKKLEGEWKIISKAADRAESDRSGKRILLMATNAGGGERFSDLIDAYETAMASGYTVDIASPEGGAITFKKVDMRNPKHKSYFYDADFIYALEHSLPPADISVDNYTAAKYVGRKRKRQSHSALSKLYTKICTKDNLCEN